MTSCENCDKHWQEVQRLNSLATHHAGNRAMCEEEVRILRAQVAAARAVIAGYEDIREHCASRETGARCLLCDLRNALEMTPPPEDDERDRT